MIAAPSASFPPQNSRSFLETASPIASSLPAQCFLSLASRTKIATAPKLSGKDAFDPSRQPCLISLILHALSVFRQSVSQGGTIIAPFERG